MLASYAMAKEHLSEAELTFNLESDTERENICNKRQRKKRVIVLPGENYTSREYEEESCRQRKMCKLKSKINQFPPPPSRPHPSQQVFSKSPLFRLVPLNPITPSPISLPDMIEQESPHSSSFTGNSSMHTSDPLQLKGNEELIWKVLGELTETSERLEKKMDKVLSILEAQPAQPREVPENLCLEERILAQLPVKVEEMDAFESKLQDPAVKQRLIKYLSTVGGKDVKATSSNLMRRLFIDEIGEKYSLTGKAGKSGPGKKPFIKTASFRLIYDLSLRKFPNAEESQIREAVSDWLMQAKFRRLRRESRENKLLTAAEEQEETIK